MMKGRGRVAMLVLTVVVLLLFGSELIFSSLPSLGRLEETAVQLNWSSGGATIYFALLALFDAVGALLAGWVLWRRAETAVRGLTVTLLLYGLFQLIVAFLLPSSLRFLYVGIGVVYAGIGAIYGRYGGLLFQNNDG